MNKFLSFYACVTLSAMVGVTLVSCNKDDVIESNAKKPIIMLDSETGVYTAKVGQPLTIAPEYQYVDDYANIAWTVDGETVNIGPEWTMIWDEIGECYATITAKNAAGTTAEDIRIDVLELTPPIISMILPDGGLNVYPGSDCVLAPDIQHADMDGFSIAWFVNNVKVGEEMTYTFNRSEPGVYKVKIIASNCDGTAEKEFDITVGDASNYEVLFPNVCEVDGMPTIYSFAGNKVCLNPFISGFNTPKYSWEIDGSIADTATPFCSFTPTAPGKYQVKVTVTEGGKSTATKQLSRNASMLTDGASAIICVAVVAMSEDEMRRDAAGGSSAYASKVFEWLPAPGQFINEISTADGSATPITSPSAACAWAKDRLDNGLFVSLGAFGGYVIVGFDHSVPAGGSEYDFIITGNAFLSTSGGSNEPGIVWVMQDVNGNGLPDDQWYELAGSEASATETRRNFAVTYHRPAGSGMDVPWTASDGSSGKINYMIFHTQESYYPAWVNRDRYTLYGTYMSARNSLNPSTGFWNNAAFDWGYADNIGSDNLTDNPTSTSGQRTGFKIANAIYADGSKAELKYIDFIKVQTAVLANSGALGEVSTEVCGFTDYSLSK